MNLLLKIVLSAALIGLVSELGRRNAPGAALLAALPLVSLLSMVWIYHDTHDLPRLARFSWSVFWYVLPSLIFFVLLPVLLQRAHVGFYPALLLSGAATVAGFIALRAVLGRFGIVL